MQLLALAVVDRGRQSDSDNRCRSGGWLMGWRFGDCPGGLVAAPNAANTDRFCATSLFDMRGGGRSGSSVAAAATESGINKWREGGFVSGGRKRELIPPSVALSLPPLPTF